MAKMIIDFKKRDIEMEEGGVGYEFSFSWRQFKIQKKERVREW